MERVAVLGASNKEDRYSYKAVKLLLEHGHSVIPIHPKLESILDQKVVKSIKEISGSVDTLSLYVKPQLVEQNIEDIITLNPKRVIFNPGTESRSAMERLEKKGIKVVEGCTLIMLKTGQY